MVAVRRAVTVAAGVLAPGHLGELTGWIPFELVDDVLEQTMTVQRRTRLLPSRVGACFVLALALWLRLGGQDHPGLCRPEAWSWCPSRRPPFPPEKAGDGGPRSACASAGPTVTGQGTAKTRIIDVSLAMSNNSRDMLSYELPGYGRSYDTIHWWIAHEQASVGEGICPYCRGPLGIIEGPGRAALVRCGPCDETWLPCQQTGLYLYFSFQGREASLVVRSVSSSGVRSQACRCLGNIGVWVTPSAVADLDPASHTVIYIGNPTCRRGVPASHRRSASPAPRVRAGR